MTPTPTPRGRRSLALAFGLLSIPLTTFPVRAEPGEERSTERFEFIAEEATPNDGDTIQTYTPTLPVSGSTNEVLIHDARGAQVGASGLTSGWYTVADGLLHAGGEYEWETLSPRSSRASTAIPEMSLNGSTIYVGPSFTPYERVQAPQSFRVGTGSVGANHAAQGLFTRFWSMVDVDEFEDPLPPELQPSPGTRVPMLQLEAYISDAEQRRCISSRTCSTPNDPSCSSNNWRETYILCGATFHVSLMPAADSEELSDVHLDVEHNITGNNVTPTFATTFTSDLAGNDGFSFSTEDDAITAGFGLRSAFAVRGLGTLRVPESGTYQFGTRSSGGARFYIYDPTEDDLQKELVTNPSAWRHPSIDGQCYGDADRVTYNNKLVGSWSPWNNANTYYDYEYHESDNSWWQPDQNEFEIARADLYENCAIDNDVLFGGEVELEAGRSYPVQFDAWYGPIQGRIEIHVTEPSGQTRLLPFEWLEAADDSVIDFDRRIESAPPTGPAIPGASFAMSGLGHTMAALDPEDGLLVYEADGFGGWATPTAITHRGEPIAAGGLPTRVYVVPDKTTIAGGESITPELVEGRLLLSSRQARLASGLTIQTPRVPSGNGSTFYETTLDAMELQLRVAGAEGSLFVDGGTVSGRTRHLRDENGVVTQLSSAPVNNVAGGWIDVVTGSIGLELTGNGNLANTALVVGTQDLSGGYTTRRADTWFSQTFMLTNTPSHASPEAAFEQTPDGFTLQNKLEILQSVSADQWGCPHYCDTLTERREIRIDSLSFTFDRYDTSLPDGPRPISNVSVSGSYFSQLWWPEEYTNDSVASATGTIDPGSGQLEIEFRTSSGHRVRALFSTEQSNAAFHNEAVAFDDLGTTLVVAPDRAGPLEADVLIVSKVDNCEPLSDDNATVVSVGIALDEAGIPRPFSTLPARIRQLPVPGTPGNARQELFADNPAHVGRIMENDYVYLEWTAQGQLAVRTVEEGELLWSTNPAGAGSRIGWQGDGNLVIYDVGGPVWATGTQFGEPGYTLRLVGSQAVIMSESGLIKWTTPGAPIVPDRGPASQAVKITPDGRTIAIQQPSEAGLRIDVLDRATPESPWVATGSFPIDGSAPNALSTALPTNAFAIGADAPAFDLPGDFCYMPDPRPYSARFLAYPSSAGGDSITIRSQSFAGQPWVEVAELTGHRDVSSLAFDHWSDNLAVGEPGAQKVTIYSRLDWRDAGGWFFTKALDPPGNTPDFGAKVEYTFGVLGISSREGLRTYRRVDTGSHPEWIDFSDWAVFAPSSDTSDNEHLMFSVGGDPTRVVAGAAQVESAQTHWHHDAGLFDDVLNFRR